MLLVGEGTAKWGVDVCLRWGYSDRRRCLVLGDCRMWTVDDGHRGLRGVVVVVAELAGPYRPHHWRESDSEDRWVDVVVFEKEERWRRENGVNHFEVGSEAEGSSAGLEALGARACNTVLDPAEVALLEADSQVVEDSRMVADLGPDAHIAVGAGSWMLREGIRSLDAL